MNEIALSCLRAGECGVIQSLSLYSGKRRRLRDLGLLPGTVVRCAHVAPSGSPMAFWMKGALIALRKEDCCRIRIRRCA